MGEPQVSGASAGFTFTGSGGEYFRIWSVNLLLSFLSFGIYSAWAKVRREQYFHRNTLLAGSGFDYHGDPRAILKGRLVAWGLVALLGVTQKFSPELYLALLLASLPLLPWLLLRSIRFRAANTSFRGLRFRHRGSYSESAAAYLGHGLLTLLPLGLWLPVWMRTMRRFQLGKLSFGGTDFDCQLGAGAFYGAYAKAGLLAAAPLVLGGVLAGLFWTAGAGKEAWPLAALIPLLVRPFLQVRLANLTWNATTLGARRFASTQALRSFAPLHAGNLLLIVLTLGLYWPWAKVREAAYRAEHFAVEAADLDAFVAHAQQQASAVGEEIADVFDLDIAL